MWRRTSLGGSLSVPTYHEESSESHAHSPRRRVDKRADVGGYETPTGKKTNAMENDSMNSSNGRRLHQISNGFGVGAGEFGNEFGIPVPGFDWLSGIHQMPWKEKQPWDSNKDLRRAHKSSTDTSMPDYVSNPTNSSFEIPAMICNPQLGGESSQGDGTDITKPPSNTETGRGLNAGTSNVADSRLSFSLDNSYVPKDMAVSLTDSILQQPPPYKAHPYAGSLPATEVRSKKERRKSSSKESPLVLSPIATNGSDANDLGEASQQTQVPSGSSILWSALQSPQVGSSHAHAPVKEIDPAQRIISATFGTLSGKEPFQETGSRKISGISEKGTKRERNMTVLSAKANVKEDEEERGFPRARLTPFAEGDTTVVE
ncbi:hypothetical protein GMORB2_0754 [Geosmithia morbida]|uniref:Uncharacterized protein n=1 Tax=Geosmithia morbida TaxID=1094350 RepID=A0A9P4Z3T6_9HYPO|nr:uncharacterized protein GMORB2_0754 [Geosmithia morbida]KAF4127016.1 hypothetical protein GMORB2_0754 [Geosmithia morbida]